MNETKKRIKAYQEALPHMKERVIATAMLLVVAATMMVSASFAWMTLSLNPEVSSLTTTITANGNLEIALSDELGQRPTDTAVGDGNGNITQTNKKWGNLINLSHESYGLDHLTLRPASLNTASLATSPMIAVNYGQDGRIEGYLTDFSFSNFNKDGVFEVYDVMKYGVRAISSVEYSNAGAKNFYQKQLNSITASQAEAKTAFDNIYNNSTYMNTVTALVSAHVDSVLNGTNPSCLAYMENLENMVAEFNALTDMVGQTYVDIINLYLYDDLADNGQAAAYESLAYELKDLKKDNYKLATQYADTIEGLSEYIYIAREMANVDADLDKAKKATDGDVLWSPHLKNAANRLCDMSTATIDNLTVSQLQDKVANIGSNVTELLSFFGGTKDAVLKDGILKEMDQLLGEPKLYVGGVELKVKYKINLTITANIMTDAKAPYGLLTAYEAAYTFASTATDNDRGIPSAADTYGMAIDFWVRTNEENALLMLEGEVIYVDDPVPGYDANNQEVPLYQYTKTVENDGNTQEVTVDIYQVKNASTGAVTWYNASTHQEEDIGNAIPVAKTVKKPSGYQGVNRVWDELDDPNNELSQNLFGKTSITQGSGSCYIFYPASPEDQQQSLHLLEAMSVAFISENGKLLGEASMDTSNAIEDAGRVIVPLKMRVQGDALVVGKDQDGNDITESYYITPLRQNEEMRVTAIVYLEGKGLSNSDVLAAGTINGQLNIQFGLNKMDSAPVKDAELIKESYEVQIGIVDPTKAADAADRLVKRKEFEQYNKDTCKVDLELTLIGMEAGTVKGQFISYINASQGARQQEFNMVYDEATKLWKATVPFSGPGNFKLRSIEIDGVDILLPEEQILSVEIKGLAISSLTCLDWGSNNRNYVKMTADPNYQTQLHLVLNSGVDVFHKIQGVFIGNNNKNVTVDFTTQDKTNYYGYANFTYGGTYTLSYVIIDGVYTALDGSMHKQLELKLNLKTTVILGYPVDEAYEDLVLEMEQALEAAASESERETIRKTYETRMAEHLELLHYGNGIAGDPNENGLALTRDSKGNMSLVTDCTEPLFMDVRCIITDDQGNSLSGLTDVELEYRAGSIQNKMDSDMSENKNASYYAGRFVLESNGAFTFTYVSFTDANGERHTITSAVSAPSITAIQPEPMAYVSQVDYDPVTYQLGMPASERVLYIKLKNAAAAQLQVTLLDSNDEEKAPAGDVYVVGTDANNVTTFAVPVSDGYSKIDKVLAKNVFYNGTFYTGAEDDPTTWLDLNALEEKDLVRNDNIATTFITEATIKVTGSTPSQAYENKAFMADNTVSGFYVEVLSGNKPLEQVLKDAGIAAEVTFQMTYDWNEETYSKYGYTYSGDGSKLPQNVFTTTYDEENHKAVMGAMNFKLAGEYQPKWTVTIDHESDAYTDISHTYTVGGSKSSMFSYNGIEKISSLVTVSWIKPKVEVSTIKPNGSHTSVYYEFSLLGNSWKSKTVTSSIATDKLSCTIYAYMQPSGWKGTSMTQYPWVELKLSNMGAATGATLNFKKGTEDATLFPGTDRTNGVSFFVWSAGSNLASRYVGSYDYGSLTSVNEAGTITGTQVNMTYGELTFIFTLDNAITINNLEASK